MLDTLSVKLPELTPLELCVPLCVAANVARALALVLSEGVPSAVEVPVPGKGEGDEHEEGSALLLATVVLVKVGCTLDVTEDDPLDDLATLPVGSRGEEEALPLPPATACPPVVVKEALWLKNAEGVGGAIEGEAEPLPIPV